MHLNTASKMSINLGLNLLSRLQVALGNCLDGTSENRSRSTGFSTVCANLHAVLKSSLPQNDASTRQDSSTSPPTQHHPAQCTIQPTTLKDPDHIQTNPKTVKISTVFTIHPKTRSVQRRSIVFIFLPEFLLQFSAEAFAGNSASATSEQTCHLQKHFGCDDTRLQHIATTSLLCQGSSILPRKCGSAGTCK